MNVTTNVAAVAQKPTTSARTAEICALNVLLKKFVKTVARFVRTVLLLSVILVA